MEHYDRRGTMRRVTPFVFLVLAVAAFASGSPWGGIVWLSFAALFGLTLSWRVQVDEAGVTLWFPFGRRTRYPRAEVAVVKNAARYRSLALKGRGWWRR